MYLLLFTLSLLYLLYVDVEYRMEQKQNEEDERGMKKPSFYDVFNKF